MRIGFFNEGRGDSFIMHQLAESMVNNGYAKWILNPLSYFGLYPLSYPTAYPALLASTISLLGLDGYYGVLFLNLFFTVFLAAIVFMFARCFGKNDDSLAIVACVENKLYESTPILIIPAATTVKIPVMAIVTTSSIKVIPFEFFILI